MKQIPLEYLVRLLVSLLIMVATIMLAMGEDNLWLPLLTLVVLAVSAYFTDWKGRLQLKQSMADGLALLVVLLSAAAALRTDRQGLLVVVANLQCYLQYVLLFQPKKPRIIWQLALLSLGQVAIASTLLPDPIFGFLLLLYLVLGVVTFALLLHFRETTHVAKPAAAAGRRELVLVGSTAAVPSSSILRGLILSALALCGVTVVLSSVMFLLLPRWSVASFEIATTEPLRMVGYSKTVTLGELGEVVNNPDLVARITLYRGRSNRPLKLAGEPLFRGTVVTRYEGRTWSQPSGSHPLMLPTEVGSTVTRQRIRMEPMDVGEIFCISPVVAIDQPDPRVRLDTTTGQLLRLEEERASTLDIDIGTTGVLGNRQRTVLPCPRMFRDHVRSMLQPFAYEDGHEQFPELSALATRILAEKEIDPATDRVRAARALSDYFHQSGEFFYTLEPQNRDPNVDPLEDFVTRNRSGHCEYFAGALVLMLRSQGIPARMVIGFKGGEWNPVGMYYQVQQLHAHTWVEAHLNEDQIPESEFAGERMPRAAWLVLDPTEGTREVDPMAGAAAIFTRIRQFVDYARVLWINYVASLNSKRQRQGIYEPLAAGIEAGYNHLTSVEVWQDRLSALNRSFVGRFWHWYRRHWFSWRGGLVAVGFSLCVVGVAFATRALRRFLLRRGWWGQPQLAAAQPMLEMYRRLEAALARVGLTRPPAQTAYEFALSAGGELSEQVEHRRLAHLPRRVVESFYRVRFGNRPLDTQEAEAVENALAELERSLPR